MAKRYNCCVSSCNNIAKFSTKKGNVCLNHAKTHAPEKYLKYYLRHRKAKIRSSGKGKCYQCGSFTSLNTIASKRYCGVCIAKVDTIQKWSKSEYQHQEMSIICTNDPMIEAIAYAKKPFTERIKDLYSLSLLPKTNTMTEEQQSAKQFCVTIKHEENNDEQDFLWADDLGITATCNIEDPESCESCSG